MPSAALPADLGTYPATAAAARRLWAVESAAERLHRENSNGDWSRNFVFDYMRERAKTLPSVIATSSTVKNFKLDKALD